MSRFLLDTDSLQSSSDNIKKLSDQASDVGSSISSYDVECEDFDFGGAKAAINSNVSSISKKISNTSNLLNTVIDTHTSLQGNLVFEPNTSNNFSAKSHASGSKKSDVPSSSNKVTSQYSQNGSSSVQGTPSNITSSIGMGTAATISNVGPFISGDEIEVFDVTDTKNTATVISYNTSTVNGETIVAGDSGYTINDVLTKIKDICEEKGLEDYWIDICAISMIETENYTSSSFINNALDNLDNNNYSSLDLGIEAFIVNLKNNYYDKGITEIEDISLKYCSDDPIMWANNVNIVKEQIERCL